MTDALKVLRKLKPKVGDIVEVYGGPRFKIARIEGDRYFCDDPVGPELSSTLPFRIVERAKNNISLLETIKLLIQDHKKDWGPSQPSLMFMFGHSEKEILDVAQKADEMIKKEEYNPLGLGKPIPDPSSQSRFGYWRHTKSGNLYEIQDFVLQEQTITPSVLYRSIKDGTVWVRPCTEFFDGRFVREA